MSASAGGGRERDREEAARDPRHIVTPDAFEVSPELLGRPLASPLRRLAALLVDLAVVALVSRVGVLLLGLAAAAVLFRATADRRAGDALAKAFRAALGCAGVGLLLVTGCGLWLAFGPDGDDPARPFLDSVGSGDPASGEGEVLSADLADVFGGVRDVQSFRNAPDDEGAVDAARRFARRLERVGAPDDEIAEALRDLAPADAPWSDEVDRIVRSAMESVEASAGAEGSAAADAETAPDDPAAPTDPVDPEAPQAPDTATPGAEPPPDSIPLPEALERYATLQAAGEVAGPEPEALRRRILDEVGGDSLAVLAGRLDEERDDRQRAERRLEQARQDLRASQEEGGGVLRWIRGLAEDLGVAFGWATIYMTLFLRLWNGRTPGKWLMKVRVVQLDGTPLSWWESFERAGGYAAGLATGLLGFAQVFWDPNRQAIHDKIGRTVVISDPAAPERVSTESTGDPARREPI